MRSENSQNVKTYMGAVDFEISTQRYEHHRQMESIKIFTTALK